MIEPAAYSTETTDELHWVAAPDELAEGDRKIVSIGPAEIGVFRINGSYVAWRNVCPHAGAPVCRGRVEGMVLPSPVYEYELDDDRSVLRCPWHGWEFELSTGQHLADGAVRLKGHRVVSNSLGVYVEVRRRVRGRADHTDHADKAHVPDSKSESDLP